jgi:RNA polymerase sigma factor (TIGR02999 family)
MRPTLETEFAQARATIERGDQQAAESLLPLVYDQLRRLAARKLARESPGQTLQATALVHEAYLRVVGTRDPGWDSRDHFIAAAAEAMRRILVNRARDKRRLKRGGHRERVDLDLTEVPSVVGGDDLLALNEALEKLGGEDPACAELVKLRFFAGLTQEEAALALGIGRRSADRHWAYARAWLFQELRGPTERGKMLSVVGRDLPSSGH